MQRTQCICGHIQGCGRKVVKGWEGKEKEARGEGKGKEKKRRILEPLSFPENSKNIERRVRAGKGMQSISANQKFLLFPSNHVSVDIRVKSFHKQYQISSRN